MRGQRIVNGATNLFASRRAEVAHASEWDGWREEARSCASSRNLLRRHAHRLNVCGFMIQNTDDHDNCSREK